MRGACLSCAGSARPIFRLFSMQIHNHYLFATNVTELSHRFPRFPHSFPTVFPTLFHRFFCRKPSYFQFFSSFQKVIHNHPSSCRQSLWITLVFHNSLLSHSTGVLLHLFNTIDAQLCSFFRKYLDLSDVCLQTERGHQGDKLCHLRFTRRLRPRNEKTRGLFSACFG